MCRLQCLEVLKDDQPQSKKQKLSNSESEHARLAFVLTSEELKTADKCAESITVPLGFGIKAGKFISKTGSLKSHDRKQLATQRILKYCLKDALTKRCRTTLFNVLDSITELCQEVISADEVDKIESNLNSALALLERGFPLSLANITTHPRGNT